jgi:hypothetical protein
MAPDLEFVFEVQAAVGGVPVELGETSLGRRRIIPISNGAVAGPRLNGAILPGGVDWQLIRPDGVAEIEARYVLQATDGALISVVNRGLRHGPPEIMQHLIEGQPVDSGAYYFRTTPEFEVAAGPHDWLTRSIFIGIGVREPKEVRIWVFSVR